MPEINPDQPLLPSVLDRLIDRAPESRHEAPSSRNQSLRALKEAVLRDLQNLLNTRCRCVPWGPAWKELKTSMVSYGVPDMTGASFGSPKEREEFRRVIQALILQYERRLKRVQVRMADPSESIDRTIRFLIDAVLQAEPAPEPIQFDSTLHLATGTFEVKGDRLG